jgi:hypothetical protein
MNTPECAGFTFSSPSKMLQEYFGDLSIGLKSKAAARFKF